MIVLVRKDTSTPDPSMDSMVDQSASRLFSLPPELRNKIWVNVLVQSADKGGASLNRPRRDASTRQQDRFCVRILRTCKQANNECTPILYGENTFRAHSSLLATLPSFLILTGSSRTTLPPVTSPRVAKMIRRFYIHVRLDTDPCFSKSQVEESFAGVEELEIDVFQAMYGSSDFSVLQLFEGVRGVGRAIVQGSVGDGRYANYLARCMEMPSGGQVQAYTEQWIGGNKAWDTWQHGNR